MKVFLIIWLGQLVSLIGSGLSSFALMVWVYQETQSVTQYALMSLCFALPRVLVSPIAGIAVDRWNRRRVMILGDISAGISTLGLFLLASTGHLQPWHIYIALFINATGNAFQLPAFLASISQLVPKEKLNLANGLRQIADAGANLISPILAGVLLGTLFVKGILLIDFLTFLVALLTLLITRFPNLSVDSDGLSSQSSLKTMLIEGFDYLKQRSALLLIFAFLMGTSFLISMVTVLFTPLVLSNFSSQVLGFLLSLGGIGMILGGVTLSIWPQNQRYVLAILNFTILAGISLLAVGLKTAISIYGLAVFMFMFSAVVVDTTATIILQKKVKSSFQGRIFALKTATNSSMTILAYISSSFLADWVFEPMMQNDNLVSNFVGQIIGVGEGKGINFMFFIAGVLTILVTVIAYQVPPLLNIEKNLPDWDE
ncbi:MFS transporter [Crocosphaera chwakensis]|uniref:Major facilitator superfamily MFS_1 n=1 Tax=Crocosphaera chwakensis CCY0110 TaxID=391612 RepID=A3IP46_9CHRO|nr:MFS transporter [Crocosphaera chwakensis]EAZ91848.1 Major facilitator superfamily MFS_1 [Crocosphaera chwakensis CCY0110]